MQQISLTQNLKGSQNLFSAGLRSAATGLYFKTGIAASYRCPDVARDAAQPLSDLTETGCMFSYRYCKHIHRGTCPYIQWYRLS